MTEQEKMQIMVDKSRKAQKIFETFSQEQVDKIVRAVARTIYDNAVELAEMTQEETKMGTLEAKLAQNTGGITWMWGHMKGKKSRGILRYDEELSIMEIAKPMGVIACVAPSTAPIVTPAHTIMCALKCGNSCIVSPHPSGKRTSVYAVKLINEAISRLGAPEGLVQVIEEPTRETRALVMQMSDVIVAVGGENLVKLAYSSGRPSFGVGPGNVQAIVDRGEDLADVVNKVIKGKTYNGGVPCTSTQFVHIPREDFDAFVEEFKSQGGFYTDDEEILEKMRAACFPDGKTNRKLVGVTPQEIAAEAGFDIPADTKIIGLRLDRCGEGELLAKEKLFPVMCLRPYDTWEEAVEVSEANLQYEGKGHSCAFFSHDQKHIEYGAERLSVCRFVVNMITTSSLGGTPRTGFAPTGAVGCGSWGGNSISENMDYFHLMNVSRIAYERPPVVIPSNEEIWAE